MGRLLYAEVDNYGIPSIFVSATGGRKVTKKISAKTWIMWEQKPIAADEYILNISFPS